MPKSTPSPMNRTANATEIRFKEPTIIKPSAAVIASPTISVMKTARMMRAERSANHRITRTVTIVRIELTNAPSRTVENSSSAMATGPVSREFAPGKTRGPAGEDVLEHVGPAPERPSQHIELHFPVAHAGHGERDHIHDPAQARILGQCGKQLVGFRQRVGRALELFGGQIEKPVALEEGPAARLAHGADMARAGSEALRQRVGCLLDQLGGRRPDDDQDVE